MTDRNVVIRLRGEIGDFQAKMVAAGRSVGGVVDKMTSGEKESRKFRDGLISVGDAGGKIGLGAAAALGGIIAVTANFEQKMSAVQAATHESAAAMEQLRDAAIEAGASTAFSASEAAQGIENLAKAGVKTQDILGGGLQGALDLAAAGTVDVGFAAETAASAMTQFGLSGEQVPHIADLLAAAAGKAQGEVSDMAYALQQSGIVASQTGLSLEETTGGLAAFASAGLMGSDAGTSFKTMLSSLTPNSEKAAAAMESIGLAAYDANGNFIGLEQVAGQLREGLRGLSDEQKQSTLETIFGSDAVRAASVLYDQGARGIREWTEAVNDQGYAAETAATKMDNLKGDFEELKGALETAFIEIGSSSQGGLRDLIQGITDAVNGVGDLPPEMQGVIAKMLAITAITGGGLWFGSKIIAGITGTRTALANLNLTATQTATAMNAAKAGAFVLVGYLVGSYVDAMDDANLSTKQLGNALDQLALGGSPDTFTQLGASAQSLNEAIKESAGWGRAINFLFGENAFSSSADEIKSIDEGLASLLENDPTKAKAAWQEIADDWTAAGYSLDELNSKFPQFQTALEAAEQEGYLASTSIRSTGKAIEDTERVTGTAARGIEGVGDAAAGAADAAYDLETALGDLEVILSGRSKNRAYEESLDAVTERLKDRRDLVRELREAESQLSSPDRSAVADAQGDVADARRDVANADTPSEREAARDRLATALERVADAEARVGESAADTRERIRDLKDQLADYALTTRDGEEAGRVWNQMFDDIAKGALENAQTLDEADRPDFLNNARKNFIDLAEKITGSRKKARELADELGLVHHQNVKPKVDTSDVDDAIYKVKLLHSEIRRMNRAQAAIRVRGGAIDQGFANGGYTGSMPVDAIAGVVHGREFVHDAQTTAMFRPLFEYIHQHRRLPGYQSGGYVQQISQPVTNNYGAEGIDYDRLARAMQMVRPLYGDVTVNGDGSFEREIRARRRSRAGGGR